ncbi:dihydrolipoyl dehydrogenase family protein [Pediococcus claussenii]|uniref:Pyridine nucleotide-disulfide oxidoreductase family protein n=1 Tax=Pediococcus claussenii (strain ATCC BAA-344 / DSM 14800 / JCM 18046 / KCTC 3811 / LMG 21948 / P06) TaxID=701521 RepID=G8PAZ2_PEDCP|nr:NAD(P)/FAD-dependent oxidoreductase [Pediococcus claussenii]AEV95860.1 pyridine nucleotide-disulfide oxidoreductase family protein [Pediococcus claussenii ATCC BAA-344]ANZ69356.1 glutathione reductase [Pediococcus claussenii]ANZ71176.1 glutathione reductase [Pediococcus claussenii]KRN20467.1 hypothetical protein IV79_GL000522 [Pediococcus claussenii]
MDFDVLFIGSGQGAWNGAIPMAQHGLKVAVIEEGKFGGVCTNRGCNAKITLDRPVEILRQVEQLQGRGFDTLPTLNWHALMIHKHEVIDGLAYGNEMKLQNAGVTNIKGHAKFIDVHTIEVNGKQYSSDKIVIDSGRRPHRLNIPGNQLFHDSTDFLVLENLPKRLAIIGGGYVGMEFATIANAFGSDVTVILRGNRILRSFHKPYVDRLVTDLKQRGIKFQFDEQLESAVQVDDGIQLLGKDGYQLTTDYVLDATGRVPNVENMNWDGIGLKYDTLRGIPVNDHLETNIPGIYASGDILDKSLPRITPTAIFESQYLSRLFTGMTTDAIDYPAVAYTVFTSPRIASVGVTPEFANAHSTEYSVETFDYYDDWFRQVGNENNGGVTIIFNKQHIIVGATSIGNDAVETINGLTDLIENKVSHSDVERLIYIFPSIAHSYMRKI